MIFTPSLVGKQFIDTNSSIPHSFCCPSLRDSCLRQPPSILYALYALVRDTVVTTAMHTVVMGQRTSHVQRIRITIRAVKQRCKDGSEAE
jgi:hypothetical protein